MKKYLAYTLLIIALFFTFVPRINAEDTLDNNEVVETINNEEGNENLIEGDTQEGNDLTDPIINNDEVVNNDSSDDNNDVILTNDNDTTINNDATTNNDVINNNDNEDDVVTPTNEVGIQNTETVTYGSSGSEEPTRGTSDGDDNYNIRFFTSATADPKSYFVGSGTDVLLSTLITKLELGININNVTSVTSNDETLIEITNSNNDYNISVKDKFASSDTVKTITINLSSGDPITINVKTPIVPEHEKDKIDNGDGTYNLFLSVTGDADKEVTGANIVVVFDTSGSMRDNTYTTTTGNSGTQYGYVDDSFVSIYRGYDGNWYVTGSNERYNGVRYVESSTTRLQAAKNAVNNLASGLLGINTNENPDLVYMALVDFANYAVIARSATTSYAEFTAAVNALSAEGSRGTNWEDALYFANLVTFPKDYKIYVIFVSDGEPTYRNTREQNGNGENGSHTYNGHTVYGSGNSDNNGLNYKYALQNAKAIVDAGKEFYTIGVFTNVNKMRTITTEAGASINNYYTAMASDELEAALDEIMGKIKNAGIGAVTVSDGTTSNVTTTTNEIAELLDVDETSYKYYLEFDVEPAEQNSNGYTHKFDKYNLTIETVSGNNVNVTISFYVENDLQTATYTGTLDGNHLVINWDKATSFVDANPTATDSPVSAHLVNGAVEWNLTTLKTLLNDVTYKVEFTVWPSQYTLDLIADLKNGDQDYETLDANIKKYLIRSGSEGNYSYTLLTNTTATITFTDSRTDDGEMSSTYDNPDPVATATSDLVTVAKEWENGIDDREPEPIELFVTRDGEIASTITLPTSSDAWSDTRFISVGIMTRDGNHIDMKTTGHDYTIIESENMSYYWEIDVPTVHPMMINNVLYNLYLLDDSEVPQAVKDMLSDYADEDGFYCEYDSKEYYYIKDYGYYIVSGDTGVLLTAINNRRSVLDIQKELTGSDANMDELFDFEVTLVTPDGDDVWFSIAIGDEPISVFYHDPITDTDVELVEGGVTNANSTQTNLVKAQIRTSKTSDSKFVVISETGTTLVYSYDGGDPTTVDLISKTTEVIDGVEVTTYTYYTRYYSAPSGTAIKIKLKDGWNLRFINLLTGTTYEIKEDESTLDEGYIYVSSNGERVYSEKNDNNEVEEKTETIENESSTKATFKGTIGEANSDYIITYNNEYVITHVDGTKVWSDSSNAYNNRPDSITLLLEGKDAEGNVLVTRELTVNKVSDDEWSYSFTNLPVYVNNKLIIYTVKEISVTGYTTSQSEDTYTITNTLNTTSISGNKSWEDNNNEYSNRPDSITVVVEGKDSEGNVLFTKDITVTGTGNSWAYSLTDLPVYINKLVITYSVKELSVAGYTTEQDGTAFTNTTEVTSISGTKSWADNSNQYNNRPQNITVVVEGKDAEGNVLITKNITVSGTGDEWSYSLDNLPTYINKKAITYTVKEVSVTGYTTTQSEDTYTITDTLDTTSISGTKTWVDNDNLYNNRPQSITVVVEGKDSEGNVLFTKDVTVTGTGNEWSYSLADLPTYINTLAVTYSVKELSVTGYTTEQNGTAFTNTLDTTEISGTKTWVDNDNLYNNRPQNITVVVEGKDAEGNVLYTKDVTVTGTGNEWSYSLADLPTYINTLAVTYSVKELSVTGYTTEQNGTAFTNTLDTTEISGTKTWADNSNQYNNRPQNITVVVEGKDSEGNVLFTKDVTVTGTANEWSYSLADLPTYINTLAVTYSVKELSVTGYTTTQEGTAFTNTLDTTSINITKNWVDNSNENNNRPQSITIVITGKDNDGNALFTKTETINTQNGDTWTYEVNNLPIYINNKTVTYTVQENQVSGYSTQYSEDTYTITNTEGKTSVNGTKTWIDSNDLYENRPDSITIVVTGTTASGYSKEYTQTITGEGNTWSYSFTDLPISNNNETITYTVSEVSVDGYVTTKEDNNITNTLEVIESVSGSKIWSDNSNEYNNRPSTITIILEGKDSEGNVLITKEATISGREDSWSYEFTNLPTYVKKTKVTYTVKEISVTGYTTSYSDDTYTITNTLDTTEISGTKTWVDNDNLYNNRPQNITVVVEGKDAEGNVLYTKDVTVTGTGNEWSYSLADLPTYINTLAVTYSVKELSVTGYTTEQNGTAFTNTLDTTSISGTKTWADESNKYNNRPQNITVVVEGKDADGNVLYTKDVTVTGTGDEWSYSLAELPTHINTLAITYSVKELSVTGYTTEQNGNSFTNTLDTTSISGTKSWVDFSNKYNNRPQSITVVVEGKDAEGNVLYTKDVTVTGTGDEWSYSLADLPTYINTLAVTYSVKELSVTGYTTKQEGTSFTNTLNTTSVNGTKSWNEQGINDNNLPESITIVLLVNGEEFTSKEVTAKNDWSYEFTELPEYIDGEKVTYTIDEVSVPGYTTSVNEYDVVNTRNTTEVSGSKTWSDNDNQDGIRPESITVVLLANGQEYARVTVTEKDNWSYKFTNLPEYIDGEKVTYTIDEVTVDGYTKTVKDYNLTNTHETEKISINITKVWDDEDDVDEVRPDSIEIVLLANGKEVKTVKLTKDSGWKYTFTDLDKNESGKEIEYTVKEVTVEEYESSITGNMKDGFTIKNFHEPYGTGGDEELVPPQTGLELSDMITLISENIVVLLVVVFMISKYALKGKKELL